MHQLARDLRVSVITTTRAYGNLEAEGLFYTLQGRGKKMFPHCLYVK